jgi:hypothetical protein
MTQGVGQVSTEYEEQLLSGGQGTKLQSGGTLPTVLPSGYTFASWVHARGCGCEHPVIRAIATNSTMMIGFNCEFGSICILERWEPSFSVIM